MVTLCIVSAANSRTSDDYIDANVRLGLSAAGMVSSGNFAFFTMNTWIVSMFLAVVSMHVCTPSAAQAHCCLFTKWVLQINAINGKRIHLLVPDRAEYVRSYKM